MKILFISHESTMYGAPKSMLYLIEDLKNKYNIDSVVLTPKDGDLVEELKKRNIECVVSEYHWWMTSVKDSSKFKYILKQIRRIYLKLRMKYTNDLLYGNVLEKLKEYKFDLVHSNTSVCDIGHYISKSFNIPHIWHIREHGLEDHGIDYIQNLDYVKEKYNDANAIICISNSVANKYKKIINSEKISTIYNGIKIDKSFKKNFNIDNNKIINFCTVGSLGNGKNQLEGIKAVKYMIDNGYKEFVLHIIGDGNESYKKKLIDFIDKYKLGNNVKLYGYRDDVSKMLEAMDIGIMTSKNEAFGRVTVEYMSKYMPVIGSNIGGTAELIENNVNGFLYEIGNEKDLAKYMKYFIKNRQEIERIGKNAYRIASENFNIDKNTIAINELYKEVLNIDNYKNVNR